MATSLSLPGESHGQRGLAGYSPHHHRVGYNLSDLVYTESANKQNPNTELFMELDIMIFKFILKNKGPGYF